MNTYFFLSDVHLEKNYKKMNDIVNNIPVGVQTIVIGGDVGDTYSDTLKTKYIDFIQLLYDKYEKIYLVPGNHLYYKQTIEQGNQFLKQLLTIFPQKLVVLNNQAQILHAQQLIIFGSCFWTDLSYVEAMPRQVPIVSAIEGYINRTEWMSLHYNSRIALERVIKTAQEMQYKLLVVTHYCPTFKNTTIPKYHGNPSEVLYASHLDHYLTSKQVYMWYYGHTGYNNSYVTEGGTILISNQYDDEGYDTDRTFLL